MNSLLNEVGVEQKSLFCVLQSLIYPGAGCSLAYNHMNEKKAKQNKTKITHGQSLTEEQSLEKTFKEDT